MMTKHATAADFARWEDRAVTMSDAALLYSIRDCGEAARAVDAHDAIAAGRYRDEMAAYQMELNKRRADRYDEPGQSQADEP